MNNAGTMFLCFVGKSIHLFVFKEKGFGFSQDLIGKQHREHPCPESSGETLVLKLVKYDRWGFCIWGSGEVGVLVGCWHFVVGGCSYSWGNNI